jgi:hypothetical protein
VGLSLAVLVLLFGVMPGALFYSRLTKLHNPNNPATQLDQYFSMTLAVVLIAALVIHLLACSVANFLCAWLHLPTPDPVQVAGLLLGDAKTDLWTQAISSIRQYPARISTYFLLVALIGLGAGTWVNAALKERKGKSSWYDLLTKPEVMFIILTTDIHLGDQCYLFSGWLTDFSCDKNGALDRVVLGYAQRRLNPKKVDDFDFIHRAPERWEPIAGEELVLNMKECKTINLDYLYSGKAGVRE